MSYPLQQFEPVDVLAAIVTLAKGDFANYDVDSIGEKDYNAEGELTVVPPAIRFYFFEEPEPKQEESQALNYSTRQRFAALCADQDLSADPQAQRNKSLQLAALVKQCLVGARLAIGDGVVSSPVRYLGMEALPAEGIGTAYVAAFEVEGIAQFAGPHR